jgi:hypothetical protein
MPKTELTPWFDGKIKPVHVGTYERDYSPTYGGRKYWYCFWDGRYWRSSSAIVKTSATFAGSRLQKLPWRGLCQPS